MHLVTQMQFRLTEGGGECRYLIGVDDDGSMHGLRQSELDETLKTINQMANQLNAETKIIRRRQCGADLNKWAVELLVRQIPPDREAVQYRVAVLGNVDAGKSTLVGVLTNGELDNGKATGVNMIKNIFRFWQKSKFWSKNPFGFYFSFVENRNFGQKSKFLSNYGNFV